MNKLHEYNKIRTDIITRFRLENNLDNSSSNKYLINYLNSIYIECPWCGADIPFKKNKHVRDHYIKI